MTDSAPYLVPKEPGRWRAAMLALVVHVALLVFLWVGVSWQSETPVGVEAEIWSPQNREAAPLPKVAPPPEKTVEPKPKPEPKPEPKPVIKEVIKPPVVEPVQKAPDIALEQEKKRKAELKRKHDAELEAEKQAELKQKKLDQERLQKEKDKQAQLDKDKAEKQKQKDKADADAKKQKEEQAKKAADAKAAADKKRQDAQDAAAADQRRAETMKHLNAQAGSGGSGSAAQSQGSRADAGYGNKVGARIRSNTIFNVPESLSGNPAAEFEVELLPDGSIRSIRNTKSSGLAGFDEAVARAIAKSAPFPPDKSGKVPSSFKLIHRPKEQ